MQKMTKFTHGIICITNFCIFAPLINRGREPQFNHLDYVCKN